VTTAPVTDTIEVLVPVPPSATAVGAPTFDLGTTLRGVQVGLRLDPAWRSYETVVATWSDLLERDSASVHVLVTGERVGPTAQQTRDDVEDWARLVEIGVVGLGN
jgi:hypothetical protein